MSVADLKAQLSEALDECDYYRSLVECFFTGDVPRNASLNHMILAKYGRVRLQEISKTPVLLQTEAVK